MGPNYRVLVSWDPERSVFVARAPELEHCSADGATRAEAIAKCEEEIAAQLANAKERGGQTPPALDDNLAACSGEIATTVSRTLHRDLAWQARVEGVELGPMLAEMLAAGLETRRARGVRRPNPNSQPASSAPQDDDDNRGQRMDNRGRDDGRRGRGGQPQRDGRYHAIMEDKATFIDYVRNLEQNGGQQPRRGGGGGGGGGSGGGSGGGGRRDQRGPRPQGQGGQSSGQSGRGAPSPGSGDKGGGDKGGGDKGGGDPA